MSTSTVGISTTNENNVCLLNGKVHGEPSGAEDGLAICANGDKKWYFNGHIHREDGPAIEFANGDKAWCLNGKLHREDGPAFEFANGDKAWYLNGKRRQGGPV
jgi:hypothetical protein